MKDLQTSNAALAAEIRDLARVHPFNAGEALPHGSITTANASLFVQSHFSEPLTIYATGWRPGGNLDELCEFLAPTIPGTGERYEHITYPNAEAFLSDANPDDDLRAPGSDFKTVDFTSDKATRVVPNRGLRIVLDWDRIKTMPNWQEHYTNMLLRRIKLNAFRRKLALAIASATDVPLVWDPAGAADPDYDLANHALLSGDASGVRPTSAFWGSTAELLRYATYGGTNTAKAMAGRLLTAVEASRKAGLSAIVDETRYQSGTSKTRALGAKVLLFTTALTSTEDPSNFKTAKANTSQGGMVAVYVRQISVKLWEIVVEVYESEFCASTLGVRTLSVTAS
ncbi:MAG: hypothetical protein ABI615_01790 [Chthoniobacterales bacterium]